MESRDRAKVRHRFAIWPQSVRSADIVSEIDAMEDRPRRGGVTPEGATSVTGLGRDSQATRVGRLTVSLSPIGAMLSSAMHRDRWTAHSSSCSSRTCCSKRSRTAR